MGTFLAFDLVPRTLPYFLVIAASSFLYVAMADLIPGLHRGRTDAGPGTTRPSSPFGRHCRPWQR